MGRRFRVAIVVALSACAQGVRTDGNVDDDETDGAGGGAGQGANDLGGTPDPGPICGDGVVQTGEACDDGNDSDTDACVTGCVAASCGDGFIRAGVEECDDENAIDTDDCVPGCLDAICGDGFTQTGVEDCDDNNNVGGDGCSATCTTEGAGLHGPNHTFETLTSNFYVTQFACTNSGGNPAGDALWFCQHFYNSACTVEPGWMEVSNTVNPMMHSGTNCNDPDPAGVPITGTVCIGGPCKIGNYTGPVGGLTNLICNCP